MVAKKLVIIQIDGLSYNDLIYCIDNGYAPFIKKLISIKTAEKQLHHIKPYFPGLPSSTPVIQAGIMYGNNDVVSGFRFVDKNNNKIISFENPFDAFYIENTYYKDKNGLLENNGSSYFNHFSGSAKRSIFTMSTLWKQNKLQKLKQTDLLIIFLANPFRIIKVAYLSVYEVIIEYLEALFESIISFFSTKKAKAPFIYSLIRMNMNVISRELGTLGTIIDMKRKTPIIYLNYLGYDEVSHHRGPCNKSVYRIVRAIDRNIKKIYKNKKDYELIILSDHGQSEAIPFKRIYKQSIGNLIKQLAAVSVSFDEDGNDKEITFEYIRKNIEKASKKNKIAKLLTLFNKEKWFNYKKNKLLSINIVTSSNLAQIYFMTEKKQLKKEEINKLYPEFISTLNKHPGIGIIIGIKEDNIFILTKKGEIEITQIGEIKNPKEYKTFIELINDYQVDISPNILIEQIVKMMQKPFAGDLVIIGAIIDKKAICFTDQFGTHGGFGGNQTNAFIITKNEIKEEITDATEIYNIIKKRYC